VTFTHLYIGDDVAAATDRIVADTAQFLKVGPDEVTLAAGTAEEAAAQVKGLWSAGVDTVAVRPIGSDPLAHVTRLLSAL
jgi:hypothetical protein